MGMNTALRDAQSFYKLLKEHNDDLSKVLPAFSIQRVKEGNSLSDLAMHLFCMDKTQQTIDSVRMVIRIVLHKMFPSLIENDPQAMIVRRNITLSEVYGHGVNLGIITKNRSINDKISRDYFENSVGMVKKSSKGGMISMKLICGVALISIFAVFFKDGLC